MMEIPLKGNEMRKYILYAVGLAVLVAAVAVSQTPAKPKPQTVFQLTEPEGQAWNILRFTCRP